MEEVLSSEENNIRASRGGGLPRGPGAKRYAATAEMRNRSQQYKAGQQSQKLFTSSAQSSSPFRRLNDEEVFITRETEKQKRKEAKERAKNLKIWDKKTSTSRQPLRRVKDGDIPPTHLDESGSGAGLYNFNSDQRNFISTAMHIAKSRVQFSQGEQTQMSRPQNIKEFVDQKKEMFLVELSFNTVKREIEDLDLKQKMKKTAIENSQALLQKDEIKLMKFIENDQIKTSKKEKKAKKAMRDCQQLQDENKDLDNKINLMRSEISKNRDILSSLEDHKRFLLDLSKIMNAGWVVEQQELKKKKRNHVKKRWIEQHRHDTRDDHIIFREDDDLFSAEALFKGAGGSSVADQSEGKPGSSLPVGGAGGLYRQRRAAGGANPVNAIQFQQLKRENMTEKDWEAKFELLFAEDLVQLEEDFFDEALCFEDPNDLNKIFSELEEQNLYLIHQSQEFEESLEKMQKQRSVLERDLGSEVELHKKNKNLLLEQIKESQASLNDLKKKSSAVTIQTSSQPAAHDKSKGSQAQALAEMEVNIEDLLNDLRREICKVYRVSKGADVDLQAKQTLDILTEVEVEIEDKMSQIHFIERIDETEVAKEERLAKQAYKREVRDVKQKEEQLQIDKKNEELKSRMKRVYEKVGRQAMPRSQKKSVKREIRVVKIDQETLDRQRYLGEMIPEPMAGGAASGGQQPQ